MAKTDITNRELREMFPNARIYEGGEAGLPEPAKTSKQLSGRVLITGGAGFIGRAIVRSSWMGGWNCSFTIVSRDEQKQDHMKKQIAVMRDRYEAELLICSVGDEPVPPPTVKFAIMDINDTQRLADVMVGHDTVIHAAALKYIPEAEREVAECLNVNLQGSMSVATAARSAGVDRVVALSTDKAVSPLNVYGATKFLMERLYSEMDIVCANLRAAGRQEPHFTTVRYGNVIGSTGSVIPNFLKQLEQKGKVYITDPAMTRFWITYQEAIDLICEAAVCSEVGVTVVPSPKAMNLKELAQACIQIRIENEVAEKNRHEPVDQWLDREGPLDYRNALEIVGIRPGEKLDEDLINEAESLRTVYMPDALGGRGGYLLLPPGYTNGSEPFYLNSKDVESISVNEMVAAIRESLLV